MKMTASDIARKSKYAIFAASFFFNLLLAFFPEMLPSNVQDRVLISFTTCLVITLLFALEEQKLFLQEKHEETLARLGHIDDYALLNDLSRRLRKVQESGDALFCKLANEAVRQAEATLSRASHGEIILDDANTASAGIELARGIRQSLHATSIWHFDPLHGGGKIEYLERLAAAIATRGVCVQRLFVIQPGVEHDAAFLERARRDMHDGVEVKYLHVADWAATHDVTGPEDFGIWDGRRVWIGCNEPYLIATRQLASLHNDKATIAIYEKTFRANWEKGHRMAPSPAKFLETDAAVRGVLGIS